MPATPLHIDAEVESALVAGAPVVALESTIIAHGLPYPDNLDVATELESTVRQAGAVPATIAIVDGTARVGVQRDILERIAGEGAQMAKAGVADLAACMAAGRSAATTVSSTAALAARAGIRVFATGGIGGAHRGDSGDISSDLGTIASTPIAVVSAGAKAILDLPRTLETLETLGVLVLGYQTDEFPAFYTRESGLVLEHRVDDAEQVAAILALRFDSLGQGGVLVANPIPEHAALDPARINAAIDEAIAQAAGAGIHGKRLTPFLLARIAEVTGGVSVRANRALAVANARLAAEIASAYARHTASRGLDANTRP